MNTKLSFSICNSKNCILNSYLAIKVLSQYTLQTSSSGFIAQGLFAGLFCWVHFNQSCQSYAYVQSLHTLLPPDIQYHPGFPCHFLPSHWEKRDKCIRGISRKNPHDAILQIHTSVNQNLTLPTAHIYNKTSDFHSCRKLKHVTPNSEFSGRIREHENYKKLKNSTLENTSWN